MVDKEVVVEAVDKNLVAPLIVEMEAATWAAAAVVVAVAVVVVVADAVVAD